MGKVLDDYLMVDESVDKRLETVQAFEEYGSTPLNPVRCEIRLAKVDKWNKEQKMPSEPPGASGRHLHVEKIDRKKDSGEEVKHAERDRDFND